MKNSSVAPLKRMTTLVRQYENEKTASLVHSLKKELAITVERVIRIAAIVRVLESRGFDFDDLKLSMVSYLRRVASGHTLPEVVVNYQDRPLLLAKVALLAIEDQTRLLSDAKIDVLRKDGTVVKKGAVALNGAEQHQVFNRGRIRSVIEQREWLGQSLKPESRPKEIRVDKRKRGLYVSGQFISSAQLRKYLSEIEE